MRAVECETAAVRAVECEAAAMRAAAALAAECERQGRRIKGAGEGVARGGVACSAMPRAGLA